MSLEVLSRLVPTNLLLVFVPCVLRSACGTWTKLGLESPTHDNLEFIDCAPEGELCVCPGIVRFGTDDVFADKCLLGGRSESGVICSPYEFGNPAPGRTDQYCRCAQVSCSVAGSEGSVAGTGTSPSMSSSVGCVCTCRQSSIGFECSLQELCLDSVTITAGKPGNVTVLCPAEEIVMRCADEQKGTLLLRAFSPHISAFVRISGPAVDTVLFDKMEGSCGLWSAEYLYCGGGSYHANVYTLFKDSDPSSVLQGESFLLEQVSENAYRQVNGLHDEYTLVDLQEPVSLTWWEEDDREPHRNCTARWRWPSDAHTDGVYEVQKVVLSRHTTYWRYLMPDALKAGLYGLGWHSRRTNYHPSLLWDLIPPYADSYWERTAPTLSWMSHVLAHDGADRFCFVGDSQMRNLFNSIVVLLSGEPASGLAEESHMWERRVLEVRKGHGHKLAGLMRFFLVRFPHQWCGSGDSKMGAWCSWSDDVPPFDTEICPHDPEAPPPENPGPAELDSCTQLFLNVGQWPLYCGWNMSMYHRGLRALIAQVADFASRHNVPVTVLATNPYPLFRTLSARSFDFRLPHLVRGYNEIARKVVHVEASPWIQFLDTWPTAFALFDLSFDGGHYQGILGMALAMTVLGRLAENYKNDRS